MQNLTYTIANNYKTLQSGSASTMVVPGIQGDVGVINSSRVFSQILTNGVVYIFDDKKVTDRYFVLGGTMLCNNNKIFINCSETYNLSKITTAEIESLINTANQKLQQQTNQTAKDFYTQKLTAYNLLKASLNTHNYK